MYLTEMATSIDGGWIHYFDHSESIARMEWVQHPTCPGVYLKHLIKDRESNGLFSSHLIKINPNCRIETHCHEHQLELHEIIQGHGSLHLLDHEHKYQTGKMAIIPKGSRHMGITPYEYLQDFRIAQAQKRLLQSESLADIAIQSGFVDQSHFSRIFKKSVGISPGRYCRLNRDGKKI